MYKYYVALISRSLISTHFVSGRASPSPPAIIKLLQSDNYKNSNYLRICISFRMFHLPSSTMTEVPSLIPRTCSHLDDIFLANWPGLGATDSTALDLVVVFSEDSSPCQLLTMQGAAMTRIAHWKWGEAGTKLSDPLPHALLSHMRVQYTLLLQKVVTLALNFNVYNYCTSVTTIHLLFDCVYVRWIVP